MSILTKVETKGWRGRLFLGGVTLALIIGGASMLYPFLLMVSGAMRSHMDASEMSLVPGFLADDSDLIRKFVETKYNYNPIHHNRHLQLQDYNFASATVNLAPSHGAVTDFRNFVAEYRFPCHWLSLGGTLLYQNMASAALEAVTAKVRERFNDDLNSFNNDLGAPILNWWMISRPPPQWEAARTTFTRNGLFDAWFEVSDERDLAEMAVVNLTGYFLEQVIYPTFGMHEFAGFQRRTGVKIDSYSEFALSERVPPATQPELRQAWLDYIFERRLNLSFVRSDATDADYRAFVANHFGTVEKMKQYWGDNSFATFAEVRLPSDKEWVQESQRELYRDFLKSLPAESLRLVGPEFAWRQYLKERYGSPDAAGAAHGQAYASWEQCPMPLSDIESDYVLTNSRQLRWHFATRNFRIVIKQMFVQGRSFANSVIYVALALLFALTLQPLVAYALSRFQPRGTWKIIFIFVATMAFPPMVGMIPQFLIIKKLGLLNTFLALVLPVSVNGMLIFLLKGFFDSIPKDLYDAAVIDGASEFRIFWQITMSMSTPILAVVALQTFSGAWNAFMYPLIVCPDQKMHVIAVWLQQFQQQASSSAIFASIIVASFPSLLIFIFAQRTIMRGIAVPSEK